MKRFKVCVVAMLAMIAMPLVLVTGGIMLFGVALAQSAPPPDPTSVADITSVLTNGAALLALGASVWGLSKYIRAVVAFIKTNWNPEIKPGEKFFSGWKTYGLSILLGLVFAFLITRSGGITDIMFIAVPEQFKWIAFGVAAGLLAAGGVDLARQGGSGAQTPANAAAGARPWLQ